MNKEINERIAAIKETATKKNLVNFDLQKDYYLSLTDPAGITTVFKQKRHELKQQIADADKSMIGNYWITNGCNYDLFETDWINKYTEIALKTMDEKTVWQQLELFLDQYLLLLQYENIIKESEPGPGNNEPIIEKEFLILIYRKFKNWITDGPDLWIERFVYPNNNPVKPIIINKKATEGSDKLVLLAILAAIQPIKRNSIDFEKFVHDRFGIPDYEKAKSTHKGKKTFIEKFKECNKTLAAII